MVLKVYGVPLRLKCCLILPLISVMYEIRPIKWFCKVLQSSNCALEWRKSSIAMECWAITTSINQTCPEKDLRAPFWNIPKISFLCSTWDVRPPSKVLVWDIPARSFFVSLGMFLELKWDVPGSSRTPRWDIPGTYLGCMCVVWELSSLCCISKVCQNVGGASSVSRNDQAQYMSKRQQMIQSSKNAV